MDELIFSGELLQDAKEYSPFMMANVVDVDHEGVSISVNGGLTVLQKKYSRLQTGQELSKGDRVLVAKISGTYVILGKVFI